MTTVIGILFAAASILGAMLLYRRLKHYDSLNVHDRWHDQAVPLDDAHVQELSIELTDAGFVWPHFSGEWDTVLLELNIRATVLGQIFDPAIMFRHGDKEIVQYFERGSRGRRYANLSELLCIQASEEVTRVGMFGRCVTWNKGHGRLLLMHTVETNGPVMVVAPHPDDAEIAAFGYYSKRDSWVVTLTAGERGSSGLRAIASDNADALDVSIRARVWNSIAAPMLGNVTYDHAMNLGYPDGQLADLYEGRLNDVKAYQRMSKIRRSNMNRWASIVPTHLSWDGLVEDLSTILLDSRPFTIVAPHPLLDRHYDHKYAAFAIAEAVLRSGLTTGNMLLYVVHAASSRAHPVGSADGVVSIAPWFDDEPIAQQVYSESLGPMERELKTLALDSMFDLHGIPPISDSPLHEKLYKASRSIYRHIAVYRTDFLRRGVRPNELFLVVPYHRVREYFGRFAQQILGSRREWPSMQQEMR